MISYESVGAPDLTRVANRRVYADARKSGARG